jgi:prepilin-type N-terminal cleavage/methylation domain-containing protein
MKRRAPSQKAGFTLIEMMVSVLCFALAGGIVFLLLNSGMILYAKNMSVNTAHETTRRAINRLQRDIHASVSVPQLIDGINADGSLQLHTSNTTSAAGVAFQLVYTDPTNASDTGTHYVWKDPNASTLIMIYNNGSCTSGNLCPPFAGQRLIIPLWGIESNITKTVAAGSSNHVNMWLMDEQGNVIDQTNTAGKSPMGQGNSSNSHSNNNNNNIYAICYYTNRVVYLVQGSQLRAYYKRYVGASSNGTNGTWYWLNPTYDTTGVIDTNGAVVARDITSPTPFSAVWSGSAGIASVTVTNGGSNYPASTTVTIAGGGGTGATATCTVSNKVITGVTVTNSGSGYTSTPSVTFSGGSGSGAAATAFLTTTPTTDDRYVHVQITSTDPTFSNRNYKATSSLVDANIPYRSRLCLIQ